MKLQEKEEKDENHRGKIWKEPNEKRCLLTLDSKPFRLKVKENHSAGKEFKSLAVQGKKLLT